MKNVDDQILFKDYEQVKENQNELPQFVNINDIWIGLQEV